MRWKWMGLAIGLAAALSTGVVGAQSAEDKVAADALFRAGRALVKEGKYAAGCTKLEASQKLDPATGTLLALADCYELNGQTASAWNTFKDARAMARKAADASRADEAQRRADLLEAKLPKIVIEAPQGGHVEGLEVRRNGKLVEPAMYGLEVAIDPGKQTIDASAPGTEVWSTQIDVPAQAGVTRIPVPALVKRVVTQPLQPQTPQVTEPNQAPTPSNTPPSGGMGTQKTVGIVVGVVGLGGVILGSVFGAQAIANVNDAAPFCSGMACSTRKAVDLHHAANTYAHIANVGIGLGAAGIVGGVILIAVAPSTRAKKTSGWNVVPVMGPGLATVSLTGAF